jgi:hypothetical protein
MNKAKWIGILLSALAVSAAGYEWTTDHMHVGVRWQPFDFRPENNAYDAARPVISEDSSYAQFGVAWSAVEPVEANTDYENNMSTYLKTIEQAVDACVAEGLKVEFVFWHTPAWASESGKAGGWRPKEDFYSAFVTRVAEHFKGRVDAYQLYHEANQEGMMADADVYFQIAELYLKGARAIRSVYDVEPAKPVLISTSGMSPCQACPALAGLKGGGAEAVNDYYDQLVADEKMMSLVDALNLNVSDFGNGFGCMDGSLIPAVWANYDLVRGKLDAAGYRNKSVISSESWIVWDDASQAVDVTADGIANEKDAYRKAVTIIGQCLERGLNTLNLPWSDNSSGWAMGLTKRRDYNGRIKELDPSIVIPAGDGGADIVTKKVVLNGSDDDFTIADGKLNVFTVEDYINPSDPNHLHYYIWKWFAQLAGGSDEVIRHAMAGEVGNDITVWGPGYTGAELYKMSSYNRTKEKFTVLLYANKANGKKWAKVSIPSTIQTGRYYNNEFSKKDFRGEGFAEGETYTARVVTKDISMEDGSDVGASVVQSGPQTVTDGTLTVTIGNMKPFTAIEFIKVAP